MKQRTYIAIDFKSFYVSVECRERGLDPPDTNLVVADESRKLLSTASNRMNAKQVEHTSK